MVIDLLIEIPRRLNVVLRKQDVPHEDGEDDADWSMFVEMVFDWFDVILVVLIEGLRKKLLKELGKELLHHHSIQLLSFVTQSTLGIEWRIVDNGEICFPWKSKYLQLVQAVILILRAIDKQRPLVIKRHPSIPAPYLFLLTFILDLLLFEISD